MYDHPLMVLGVMFPPLPSQKEYYTSLFLCCSFTLYRADVVCSCRGITPPHHPFCLCRSITPDVIQGDHCPSLQLLVAVKTKHQMCFCSSAMKVDTLLWAAMCTVENPNKDWTHAFSECLQEGGSFEWYIVCCISKNQGGIRLFIIWPLHTNYKFRLCVAEN